MAKSTKRGSDHGGKNAPGARVIGLPVRRGQDRTEWVLGALRTNHSSGGKHPASVSVLAMVEADSGGIVAWHEALKADLAEVAAMFTAAIIDAARDGDALPDVIRVATPRLQGVIAQIVPPEIEATVGPTPELDDVAAEHGLETVSPQRVVQRRRREVGRISSRSVHRLRATLRGAMPPIWRRFEIRSRALMSELHETIQLVFGWGDEDLHEFFVGQDIVGGWPSAADESTIDEELVSVGLMAPSEHDTFIYAYGFSCEWKLDVVVEEVFEDRSDRTDPLCLDGARAAPPEASGRMRNYRKLLRELAAGKLDRSAEPWLQTWDPEAFDSKDVNRRLRDRRES